MDGAYSWRGVRDAAFSRANIPALGVMALLLVGGIYADRLNADLHEQAQRAEVQAKVSLIRARLEGLINANLQLVRGLVAVMSTEPEMSQTRFDTLASRLITKGTQLRNVAAAPKFTIALMYPLAGNTKALGTNYMDVPAQRNSALRARDSGDLVMLGPVPLVQGGEGFIGRFPVFLSPDKRPDSFWGLISAVIDVDRLYADGGLLDPLLDLDIALGKGGALFFGSASIVDARPVVATISLPGQSWTISAVPKTGWAENGAGLWMPRGLMALAGLAILIPIFVVGRLSEGRRRQVVTLARREQDLARATKRLDLALDASGIGVWEYDPQTNLSHWDKRVHALYGRTDFDVPKTIQDWESALHPEDVGRSNDDYARALAESRDYASEFRAVLPDGSVKYIRARATTFVEPNGYKRLIGAEWDISADLALRHELERVWMLAERRSAELESANRRIEHNALHDPLTGLPNRRYLDQVLDATRETMAASGGEAALLHIDLDRFKQINDTLGHAAGDALLGHVARILTETLAEGDVAARVGGDEFVVLCIAGTDRAALACRADALIARMREPVPYLGHDCRFGVSVGIATEDGREFDAKRLMVHADIALYRAKSRGRGRYEFFTRALQAEIVSTKRTADEILNGLERDEFIVHYQPQFDATTHAIAGAEALVRWNHPARGLLTPDAFLKIADELHVVAAIDELVLERALGDFAGWRAERLDVPRLSVNVSAKRLSDEALVASLGRLDIPRGALSFELVESIFLDEDDDQIDWAIDRIKDLGIDIEIDDFGTGHASIVSLLKLRPKRLKIDRQLVMPVVGEPARRKLLGSIIEIGRSLGVEIIAEGVETMEHAAILRDLGCDTLQGYAFSRPLSAEAFRAFARGHRLRLAS